MWALSSIRSLFANIDIVLASWISKIFSFIIMLADVRIVNETVKAVIERVYVVMGLFMLFKLAFIIINYIIDPDKKQSVGKILTRIVVSLCLIPTIPVIFEKAYELQGVILRDNVIGKIIMGNGSGLKETSTDISKSGDQLAYLVFSNFIDYNRDSVLSKVFDGCPNIFTEEDNLEQTKNFDYCSEDGSTIDVPVCGYYLYYAPYSYPDSEGNYPDSRDVYYSCKDGTKLCYDCGGIIKFNKEDIKDLVSFHNDEGGVENFNYSIETLNMINDWSNIYNKKPESLTMLCGIRDGRYIYDLINYGRENYSVEAILSEPIVTATEVDPFFYNKSSCDAKSSTTKGDGEFVFSFNFIISPIVALVVIFLLIVICFDISIRTIKLSFLETFAPVPIVSYIDINSSKLFNSWLKECINTFLQLFIHLAIVFFSVVLFRMLLNSEQNNSPLVNIFLIIGILLFVLQLPKLLSQLFNLKGDNFFDIIKNSVKFTVGAGAIGASVAGGVVSNSLHIKDNAKAAVDSVGTAKNNLKNFKSNLSNTKGILNKASVINSTMKSVGNVPLNFLRVPGNIVTGGLSAGAKTVKKLYDNKGTYKSGDVKNSIRENIEDYEKKSSGISSMSQDDIKFELNELETEQKIAQNEYDKATADLTNKLSSEENYESVVNAFEGGQSYSSYSDYVNSMNQSGRDSDIISESKYDEYKKLYDEQRKFDEEIETIKKRIKLLKKYEEKK